MFKEFSKVFIFVIASLFVILLLAVLLFPKFSINRILDDKKHYTLYIVSEKNEKIVSKDFNAISLSLLDKKNKEAFYEIVNNSNITLDTFLSAQLDYYDRLIAFLLVIIGLYTICAYFYVKSVSEEKAKQMCAEYIEKEMKKPEVKEIIAINVADQMKSSYISDKIDEKIDDILSKKTEEESQPITSSQAPIKKPAKTEDKKETKEPK